MITVTGPRTSRGERPATYREVFGVREFRFLFVAHLLSLIGDELARVALAILVFDSTESPFLAAATFGISYAPWLIGGPFLAALADRFPRRTILVLTDVARGLVVALLAIPGLPLWVLLSMLFLASLLAPPFESARSALMPDVLEGDRYAVGTSLTNITSQVAQVLGFLGGGLLVLVISVQGALLVNAATFLLSAALVRWGVQHRTPPGADAAAPRSLWRETISGLQLLGRKRVLLHIVFLLWTGQLFLTAPEGVAAPLVAEFGYGAVGVGLFLAANPVGLVIGGVVVGRLCPPQLRERLTYPLAVFSVLPLILVGLVDSFIVVLLLLVLSGFGASYLIPLNVSFVRVVPPAMRGRAFGAAVSGLYACQGIAILGAGSAAERIPASSVVSWSGILGLVALLVLGVARGRGRTIE
ncbi:MAG: MFS transporter [Geodermatophilaceae bacterium]|nr:MFS transporter [Geodermatophilaceae bacterium]MDQ3474830.1 MFS transporter [Actinomycetota bacterium]